jgi:hypothetical protein
MSGKRSKLLAVVAGFLIVALIPGLAWAPKIFRRLTILNSTCTAPAGIFSGSMQVTHLTESDGVISVSGLLNGACTSAGVTLASVAAAPVSFPTVVDEATCHEIDLNVEQLLDLPQMDLDLSFEVIFQPAKATATRICRAAEMLERGDTSTAARVLNTVLASG